MNYLWPVMIIISLITAIFTGTLDATVAAGLEAAENSVKVVLSFAGMMCFWSGMLSLADASGISATVEKFLRPITHILFPKLKKGSPALKKITSNMTANLLGMGNAATPAGIDAMKELDKTNVHPEQPSDEMCIFTVLNTASVQLIPTTIISLRIAAGSANPSSILFPIWICSIISLLAALLSMKLILFFTDKKEPQL